MLPVMQVGRVRPGAPPEHDVLHPVGGGLGQARPTNNIGIHGFLGATAKMACPDRGQGYSFCISGIQSTRVGGFFVWHRRAMSSFCSTRESF
ncbi:MAG: hypothetical protein FJ404_01090 [Verrucomicrobia bacterium]|nr:hypothetical protein [Verrucomicrobiota bacterium]